MQIWMDFEKKERKKENGGSKSGQIFETARSNFQIEILSPGLQSGQTVMMYWLSTKLDKVVKSVGSNIVSVHFSCTVSGMFGFVCLFNFQS